MSIFSPNLDKFSSKFFIAPANEYDVKVAAPKWRVVEIRKGKNAGNKMYIISFPASIQATADGDAELANKPVNVDFIVEAGNEDSFRRLFLFVMACKGITAGSDEGDAEFREKYGSLDWSIDFETGTLGAGYTSLQDARVIVNVDIRTEGDKQYQNYKGCRVWN